MAMFLHVFPVGFRQNSKMLQVSSTYWNNESRNGQWEAAHIILSPLLTCYWYVWTPSTTSKAGRDGFFSQNKLCAAKLWNDDHQNCDVVNVQKWGQQKFTLALQVFWLELDGQHASECTWVYWFCWLQIRMLRSWGILLTARGQQYQFLGQNSILG